MVREEGIVALDEAREALAELDMDFEDDPEALFLMLLPGRDLEALVADLPFPEEDVQNMFAKAVEYRIRVGDKVNAEWMDEEHGTIAFILDVLVMKDLLERTT